MATEASSFQSSLTLEPIATHHPWQAALLPVTEFPIPAFQREKIALFLQAFDEVLVKKYRLSHEILHQVWKLSPQTGADVLSENIDEWSPEFGLGIWPDRKPPQGWTEEMMVDAAAAVFRGDEPEIPSHRLLRLTLEENNRIGAAGKMRGFAVQIELFSKDKLDVIVRRGKEIFQPTITERQFKKADFYLPLFDRKTLAAATSGEQIDAWLCGIELYIRESAEDKGILILSRFPIEPILDEITRRFASEQASHSV
jgi:hypothetical protein